MSGTGAVPASKAASYRDKRAPAVQDRLAAGSLSDEPVPATSPRGSAHDSLLAAVTSLAGRHGYAQLTVEGVAQEAGVCRATFYQYFTGLDDCFWSAYRECAERLLADLTVATSRGEQRELAVLDALVQAAISRPHEARLLTREGLAAGPDGIRERDALIGRVEEAMAGSASSLPKIDLPAALLIGGVLRFLSMHLEEGAMGKELRADTLQWARVFLRSARSSWSERLMPASAASAEAPPRPPSRPQRSLAPRERVLRATAATIQRESYRAATVADIVAAAGVSRKLFYSEFASKGDAAIAAYRQGFDRTIAACAPAFFGAEVWPERVCGCAEAFMAFLASEPSFAYLGFVECYALGSSTVPRLADAQQAFTLLLEEGYRQRPQGRELPREYSALTVALVFEACFQACRRGTRGHGRWMQQLAVYVTLAPFIGVDEAGTFLEAAPARR